MHSPYLHGVLTILNPMVGDVLGIRVIHGMLCVALFQPALVPIPFVTWIAYLLSCEFVKKIASPFVVKGLL